MKALSWVISEQMIIVDAHIESVQENEREAMVDAFNELMAELEVKRLRIELKTLKAELKKQKK